MSTGTAAGAVAPATGCRLTTSFRSRSVATHSRPTSGCAAKRITGTATRHTASAARTERRESGAGPGRPGRSRFRSCRPRAKRRTTRSGRCVIGAIGSTFSCRFRRSRPVRRGSRKPVLVPWPLVIVHDSGHERIEPPPRCAGRCAVVRDPATCSGTKYRFTRACPSPGRRAERLRAGPFLPAVDRRGGYAGRGVSRSQSICREGSRLAYQKDDRPSPGCASGHSPRTGCDLP